MPKEFELVPHTADLKIRAFGVTIQELFKNALKGMFISIKPASDQIEYKDDYPISIKYNREHKIYLRANNPESMLIDFLSECLYLSDVNNEAYFDVRFTVLDDNELDCIIFGVPVTHFDVEIKAITYHDLEIEQVDSLWQATIVFDI